MGCLFFAIGLVFKGIGYLFYFTLPIIFCAIGVGGGFLLGGFTMAQNQKNYLDSLIEDYTHTVTIWWDSEGKLQSEIKVREDINWNINGVLATVNKEYRSDDVPFYYDVFIDVGKRDQDKTIKQFQFIQHEWDINRGLYELPEEAKRAGLKFLGLFNTPYGGTQFVNGAGYSLRDVTMDLVLYAVWQEI